MILSSVILGLLLLLWIVCALLWQKYKRLQQTLVEQMQAGQQLQQQYDSLCKQLTELHASSVGVGQRLQSAESYMQQISARQQEFTLQDPDRRLYSRAAKMVELGADLDELIHECELPKAEAQLLLSLRKGKMA